MAYRYETHLHTAPVSKCARAGVEESVRFYKELGYDGIFITNHFLDGNIRLEKEMPYREKIAYYFSDYRLGREIGEKCGIKVFPGVEMAYAGTDFLVYGPEEDWYMAHPEIMEMQKSKELPYLRENGALVIHAHPFREAAYIDHIRLFPRCVEGVETQNASRTAFENRMAEIYAENYGFLRFAGSDNHDADGQKMLAGIQTEKPLNSVADFIRAVRSGAATCFMHTPQEIAAQVKKCQ